MSAHPLICVLFCLAWFLPVAVPAEEHWYNYDRLYLQAGTYVHYHSDDDFAGNRLFASLEAIKSSDWLYGLAVFNNSFGQFSQYLYGGMLHGYKGDYRDRVPLNDLGVSPAVIPGIGYQEGRFGADAYLLGFSGVLFTVGMDF